MDWRRGDKDEAVPKGPWSDLPAEPPRERIERARPRRGAREPLVNNWRGLLIVLFLFLGAPWLARWLSAIILGLMNGR